MAIEILMPALSPTMEEGTLAKWLVNEGDTVAAGDLLAEIETDKATMEFEAVDEGVIGKILIADGTENVPVGTAIAVLLEEGESIEDVNLPDPAAKASARADAEKPASPAAPEPKPAASQAPATPAPAAAAQPAPAAPRDADGGRIFASPLARRIAAEKGLDLTQIKGSGPRGRIVKADVESARPAPVAAKPDAPAPAAAISAGPSAEQIIKLYADRETEEIKLDGMRRIIATRLGEAKQTIPHFYLRRSAKLDALMEFRKTLNDQLSTRGIRLSVNDFIIKACALALQDVPDANAVWAGDRILRLIPSDVAVAVAIEGGLFTPVLRDAQSRTLSDLSAEMKDLAARARERRLAPHEYQGGSFAISNLGMFGIENFDAVINPPHGAILAVGTGIQTPVVEDGQVVIRNVMSMTLSVDHRVIDGALGAQLLEAITQYLENPLSMLA